MKSQTTRYRIASSLVWLLLLFSATCLAQETQVVEKVDVPNLINKLEERDAKTVMIAADALTKVGPNVIPALLDSLKQKKGCRFQFIASGIVYRLDQNHEIVNLTLIDINKGKCHVSSKNDLIVRRQAAIALVAKAEGIPVIAEMLKDKDTFIRRSAAFAFDELTERLDERRLNKINVTPEIMSATKAALPLLIQALNDKDEIVRCMSYEAVEQAQGSTHKELRVEANRLMQGVTVRCSK